MTNKKIISTYLEEETELKLRILAAKNRKSMSKYIEHLILKAIQDDEKANKTE